MGITVGGSTEGPHLGIQSLHQNIRLIGQSQLSNGIQFQTVVVAIVVVFLVASLGKGGAFHTYMIVVGKRRLDEGSA